MGKYKVIVTDLGYRTYEHEEKELAKIDAELVLKECKTADDVIRECADADALLVRWAPITARVIENLPNCRIYSRYGTGYDNVDCAAAAARGAYVTNVPDYCMEEVSDQAFALFMSAARKITSHDKWIREKNSWDIAADDPIFRISGKVFGIVGLGRIGSTFLRKIKGFNLKEILVADPYIDKEKTENEKGVRIVPLETLLKESDYISLHVPLTDETRHLVGEPELKLMKKNGIIVNTSRGPVIDNAALLKALRGGWINSAGLDVHEVEPITEDSPFKQLDNIVLSDHAAWYSEESEIELKVKVARNAVEALSGKMPVNTVPEVRKIMGK